jgi:hypothetical protein
MMSMVMSMVVVSVVVNSTMVMAHVPPWMHGRDHAQK